MIFENHTKLLFSLLIIGLLITLSSCSSPTDSTTEEQRFTLTTSVSPSGAGEITPASGSFAEGQQINLQANANEGWVFSRWEQDLNTTDNPVSLTMNRNYSVVAVFEEVQQQYTLTINASPSEGGTVSGGGTFTAGASVSISATPNEGFEFVDWTGNIDHLNDANAQNPTVTMPAANISLTANFQEISDGGETEVVTVTNPTTGRIWMDRNLGASRAATTATDSEARGHLYQWGRLTDGHQNRDSSTLTTASSSDQPGHGSFIIGVNDWRSPQNDNLWQGVNGINNPCPDGFRIPTEAEWTAERESWSTNNAAGAFDSPLKLIRSGFRNNTNGNIASTNMAYFWSSTVSNNNTRSMVFDNGFAGMVSSFRAIGMSVRCIQD